MGHFMARVVLYQSVEIGPLAKRKIAAAARKMAARCFSNTLTYPCGLARRNRQDLMGDEHRYSRPRHSTTRRREYAFLLSHDSKGAIRDQIMGEVTR